jgi:hypothetical protein
MELLLIATYGVKLTAVFILYSTKFMICYWSEHCMLRPSLLFVTGQNAVCYDQVYDLFLVRTLLRPSLCFDTANHKLGRNIHRSDQ